MNIKAQQIQIWSEQKIINWDKNWCNN